MSKQILIDGQTYPVVVAVNEDGSPIGGGSTGGRSDSAGGTIGIDANGSQWMMVVDTTATPATITYFKVSDGTTGTPVGGFTPDADQNGATAALQAAGNTALASIDADLGAADAAAATTDTGTFSLIALIKRGLQNWTALLARVPSTLGQKTSAQSLSVVVASDQTQSTKDTNGTGAVRYTTGPAAITGTTFSQVVCLTTTTFSLFTRTGAVGDPLTGVALPPGTLLIGPITAYTLSSGAVAAYV
jgi:hypothetical protein